MKFWDSSAVISLVASQTSSPELRRLIRADSEAVVWWGTLVEVTSGLCRLRREDQLDNPKFTSFLHSAEQFVSDADEIEASEAVRSRAARLLHERSLRAADALQLAAALVWAGHNPAGAGFVCLDKRLREAAEREGFTVLPE